MTEQSTQTRPNQQPVAGRTEVHFEVLRFQASLISTGLEHLFVATQTTISTTR